MCKDVITKCHVFGSGNSEEVMGSGAQAISCVKSPLYSQVLDY